MADWLNVRFKGRQAGRQRLEFPKRRRVARYIVKEVLLD